MPPKASVQSPAKTGKSLEKGRGQDDSGERLTTVTASTHVSIPLHPSKPDPTVLNPKSDHSDYEFGGPIGALGVTIMAPLTAYVLFYGCNETVGCPPSLVNLSSITQIVKWEHVVDYKAWAVYFIWYAWTVACWAVLPGDWVEGLPLRDGKKKLYKINALSTFLLTLGLTIGYIATPNGTENFSWFYDHWIGLVTASLINAIVQAVWVYVWSFSSGELLALGGNHGNVIYDFFIGRPLNPTFPGFPTFDIKTFNELRPGLILWLLVDISCLCEQVIRRGGWTKVTDSMWLVIIGHAFYVFDAMYNETGIFSQMDITTDGFGFMLAVGDLTFVPFTYSLQARYLAFNQVELGFAGVAGVIAVLLAGAYIFRISNKEKNDFRNGKNPKNLQYMTTDRGTKLLTSGWWGRSRHPNYFGDLLMALAWCLPCGFGSPIPYFYVGYFAVLLIHRQLRDDEACLRKHGKDWETYCKKVPYRIIPGIY